MAKNTWIIVAGGRVDSNDIDEIHIYKDATILGGNVSKTFFKLKNCQTLICFEESESSYFQKHFGLTIVIKDGPIP